MTVLGEFFELWEPNFTVDDERQIWGRMLGLGFNLPAWKIHTND